MVDYNVWSNADLRLGNSNISTEKPGFLVVSGDLASVVTVIRNDGQHHENKIHHFTTGREIPLL